MEVRFMGTIDFDLVRKVVNDFNEHRCTVRETAKRCEISKSTVHYYLTKVMPNPTSAEILAHNKAESAKRGGEAIARKFRKSN